MTERELEVGLDREVIRISLNLGSFRPDERDEVEQLMRTDAGRRVVAEAVREHLDGWKRGDWLDRPYVERLGNCFGRKAPASFAPRLAAIAEIDAHPAYQAFAISLRRATHGASGAPSASDQPVLAAAG
jgi:hypothetical protein